MPDRPPAVMFPEKTEGERYTQAEGVVRKGDGIVVVGIVSA